MDLDLKDKVVFAAGSSRGIGRAIAEGFVKEGSKVIVTGRDKICLQTTVEELQKKYGPENIRGFSGDLGEIEKIKGHLDRTITTFGNLDIVVGNLGSGRGTTGYDLSDSEWDRLMHINLITNIIIAREAIPHLIKNHGGSITFTASIAGFETLRAPVAYEAAKAALISAAKNLSHELAQYSIRVNCVAPGNILFPGSTWDLKLKRDEKATMDYITSNVPFRRFGTPEEIANIVVFLASDRAAFVTGACVVADGGQTKSF
jgi:3-oxoacyl-[acyl-carrier protein] reductase